MLRVPVLLVLQEEPPTRKAGEGLQARYQEALSGDRPARVGQADQDIEVHEWCLVELEPERADQVHETICAPHSEKKEEPPDS